MKHLLAVAFITLLALGTGCAWISPSSQTSSDGIQVHGHWTVTVSNPDGTLKAVHEFDNALLSDGAELLTSLLTNSNKITKRFIRISTAGYIDCKESLEYGPTAVAANISELEAEVTIEIAEGLPFILSATCTVELDELRPFDAGEKKIGTVQTLFADEEECIKAYQDVTSTVACYDRQFILTYHDLPTPLEVKVGEVIGFNVRISFAYGSYED